MPAEGRTLTSAHGRRRGGGRWFGRGLFTRLDLGGIAGDGAEDVAVQSIADEVLMNPLGQVLRGEFGEGAGVGLAHLGGQFAGLAIYISVTIFWECSCS